MTRTIARLVLAMLLLPVTVTLFVILMSTFMGGGPPSPEGLVGIWLVIYLFIAAYWVLLWREVVTWTRRRVLLTLVAGLIALASGGLLGFFVTNIGVPALEAALLIGGGLPPIVWVLATVLIWRETRGERVARLAAAGERAVICPLCGYNLTGLRQTRCPECGGHFTLDELVKSQPSPSTADVGTD